MDGLDEETRAAVIKKYIPDEPFGGVVLGSSGTMRSLFKAFLNVPMYRQFFFKQRHCSDFEPNSMLRANEEVGRGQAARLATFQHLQLFVFNGI